MGNVAEDSVDSLEEEQQQLLQEEPIVPKDDPNFKALEQDLKERKKKVEEDQAKAELLKDEVTTINF
jgi:hypothetical protein